MCEGHDAGLAAEQRGELIGIQPTALRIHAPFLDHEAARGQTSPDTAVCFVILVRDDNLVARRESGGECLRQDVGVLRSGRAKMHFIRGHTEPVREARMRQIHFLARAA
jgi:hypothetical protein